MDALELSHDLDTVWQITSSEVTPALIQRQIKRLQSKLGSETAWQPTRALAALVAKNLGFVEPAARRALEKSSLFVVDLPYCGAYSKPPGKIVIGNGLLNLITACSYWGQFSESLPNSLAAVYPHEDHPLVSLRDLLPLYVFALLYGHYQKGNTLPDCRAVTQTKGGDNADNTARLALAGACTFILLHELGHLELRHHAPDHPVIPIDMPLAVTQEFSDYQLREFEADQFAWSALKPEFRKLHSPWANIALNFHLVRETTLGERNHRHPVNINRLAYAAALDGNDELKPRDYAQHLERMGSAFSRIEAGNAELAHRGRTPILEALDRPSVLQQLREWQTPLQEHGVNIDPIVDENAMPDWQECCGL